jgi:hypothetical protein
MKSLRSIVSQLVDLTHSLCYWNKTRGALRLCIWLCREARQLVLWLSRISIEHTLQELASVVWHFDLIAYRARSRSLYEKTAFALIHSAEMRNAGYICACTHLSAALDWQIRFDVMRGDEKSCASFSPAARRAANGIAEMNSLRERKKEIEQLICTRWPPQLLIIASHIFYCSRDERK